MRIIAGKYRSRILAEFPGEDVRPTSDRVRESLFNILSWKVTNARVLDLFCGSGALGLESLSRGAKHVVFNDSSKDSLAILKKNVNVMKLKAGKDLTVYGYDYLACLESQTTPFDLIFIDPPYRLDYGQKALECIAKKDLLTENGIAVYERDRSFDGQIQGLVKYDERKYGKTYITFFKREGV